jgi:hypothetical protein
VTQDNSANFNFQRSSFRESAIEHRLLADLLSIAWMRGVVVEVARAETDQYGYDLVLSVESVSRHVQIKSSLVESKTSKQTINIALASKPSSCIVWVVAAVTDNGLGIDHFLYFGGAAGEPMPSLGDKPGRDTRTKKERSNMREVRKGHFERVGTPIELFHRLFERDPVA